MNFKPFTFFTTKQSKPQPILPVKEFMLADLDNETAILKAFKASTSFIEFAVKHPQIFNHLYHSYAVAEIIRSNPQYASSLLFTYRLVKKISSFDDISSLMLQFPELIANFLQEESIREICGGLHQFVIESYIAQLKRLVNGHYAPAAYILSQVFLYGLGSLRPNSGEAEKYLKLAADYGYLKTDYYLVRAQEEITKENFEQAYSYLSKIPAGHANYAEALFQIGRLIYTHKYLPPQMTAEQDTTFYALQYLIYANSLNNPNVKELLLPALSEYFGQPLGETNQVLNSQTLEDYIARYLTHRAESACHFISTITFQAPISETKFALN